MRRFLAAGTVSLLGLAVGSHALAGFNASAPDGVRRIFTQLAFAEGRLVSYHVLEPGPLALQAFPTSAGIGQLLRFPGCPGLRPVLDDSAAPSPSTDSLVPDLAMREVVNLVLPDCGVQPTSVGEALSMAVSARSVGFVNAPGVPAPPGADVPVEEQQSADALWGPVPNVGVIDVFAGGDLSPQNLQGTTVSGALASEVQQPELRRPRIKGYAAGRLVFFVTYETRNLTSAGLVNAEVESQWSRTGFPGERDLLFLAYGRAPLPPNRALPAGSLDSNGVPNDGQAVLNVVKGAPFWQEGDYSPLWKMHCLDGGVTPTIGPGDPCGNTRFYQIGQPITASDVSRTGFPLVGGIFRDINCPILATDVNDDGTFADTATSREVVVFPDVDWDGDGFPEDGIQDPDSVDGVPGRLFLFDATQTILRWGAVPGQPSYDVIRGDLHSLREAGGQVDLGEVVCQENDSTDSTTAPDHNDASAPAAGRGFLYLVRIRGSYGASSAGSIRVAASGDCP